MPGTVLVLALKSPTLGKLLSPWQTGIVSHSNSEPRIPQEETSGENTDTESENIRKNGPEMDQYFSGRWHQSQSVSQGKPTGGGQ